MAQPTTGRNDCFVAFVLGVSASLVFALTVYATVGEAGFIAPDTNTYLEPASRIVRSGLPSLRDLLAARRPMGYPLLIAAGEWIFRNPFLPVIFLQAIGAGCAAAICILIARALSPSRVGHVTAAVAVALSPNVLTHSALLLTDALHALAVLAGAFAIAQAFRTRREGWLLAAMLSWAGAQTLRPTMFLAAPLLAAVVYAAGRWSGAAWRPRPAVLLSSSVLLLVLPAAFLLGNGLSTGIWTTNRTDETNARLLAATILATAEHRNHLEIVKEWEQEESALSSPAEIRRFRITRARSVLAAHPVLAVRVLATNAVKIVFAPAESAYLVWRSDHSRIRPLAALLALANLAAWGLVALGVRDSWRSDAGRCWVVVAFFVSLYVVILSAPVGFQGARFRLPVDLLCAPLFGLGIVHLSEPRHRRGAEHPAGVDAHRA